MVALVRTVAYLGLEARAVEVQCQVAPGLPRFAVVGLPDKAVGESRERVQAALSAMGLALPPKRITVNLSPADLPKEGSHYDLPIALALLAAMGVTDAEQLTEYIAVGELALDARIVPSPGVLLAAEQVQQARCARPDILLETPRVRARRIPTAGNVERIVVEAVSAGASFVEAEPEVLSELMQVGQKLARELQERGGGVRLQLDILAGESGRLRLELTTLR